MAHSSDHIAPQFNGSYHVIAMDLRGHGDSDWREQNGGAGKLIQITFTIPPDLRTSDRTQKQPDGAWKRFGEPVANQEPVSIEFGNYSQEKFNPKDGLLSRVICSTTPLVDAPEPDRIRHSGLEGEHSYSETMAIVHKMIEVK